MMARRILRFDSLPSTMREAATLAAQGCEPGTAVVAEEQTAGVGRHGHAWYSERGAGLYVSVVLRVSPRPVLTLAMGVAAAEAIETVTGLRPDLRWPNDVMLRGRKAAGILVEAVSGAAIVGVGVNVNHTEFPPDIAGTATSLRIESGHSHAKESLLEALLGWIDHCAGFAPEDILREFEARSSYVRGRQVTVEGGGQGVTDGLDPGGFLILRRPDGARETIMAGGVRPA
jgi:BirA family biotin operon repressor/biotin-[acetyl-CoA-carboxylase] ligase